MNVKRLLMLIGICLILCVVGLLVVEVSVRPTVNRRGPHRPDFSVARDAQRGGAEGDVSTDPGLPEAPASKAEKTGADTRPEGTGGEGPPQAAGVATEDESAPTAGSLRVSVTDELGAPWIGLELRIARPADTGASDARVVSTGQEGTGEFDSLATGEWVVSVHGGGVSKIVQVTVLPGSSNEPLQIVIPRNGALLVGTVRHVAGGPIPNARVRLHDREAAAGSVLSARTDDQGGYRIEAVPLGAWRVSIEGGKSLGYQVLHCPDLHVDAYGEIRHDLVVGFVSLSGVVRDADTHLPISGAVLKLTKPTGTSCTSDSDGTFQFFDVPAGPGQLMVTRGGYGLAWVDLGRLDAAVARRQDIELHRAALLDVYIGDERGDPMPGEWCLDLTRIAGELPETKGDSYGVNIRADVDGYVRCSQIRPGVYDVFVWRSYCRSPRKRIEVRPGENTVRLQVPAVTGQQRCDMSAMVLRGRITKAGTGEPIRGVRVWLKASPPRETYSDAQGEYGFPDLPSGVHHLLLEKDGFGLERLDAQIKEGQQCILDAELQVAAVLHLTVLDQAGHPITGRVVMTIVPTTPESPTRGTVIVELLEDGTCTYQRIVPGSYNLSLSALDGDGRTKLHLALEAGEHAVEVLLN